MNLKDDDVEASTRERIKEAAQSGIVQLVMPGLMAIAMLFLGFAVNRLSDHFDRIDAHLAASDTLSAVDHKDISDLKALVPMREAQIKEIRDLAKETAWTVDEMQHDRSAGRH